MSDLWMLKTDGQNHSFPLKLRDLECIGSNWKKQVKDELTTRSGGINLLRNADKLDPALLETLEQFNQMG